MRAHESMFMGKETEAKFRFLNSRINLGLLGKSNFSHVKEFSPIIWLPGLFIHEGILSTGAMV